MPIRRNAAFVATVLAVAGLTAPSLAADFAEGGDFGGTYNYIGPGAGYPDYVEVAPVYPAPVYPAPVYPAPAYPAPAYAPGYAPLAPIVGQEIVETDIVRAPPPVAGYYPGPVEQYGDEYVQGPPPGYFGAPPTGYAAPPVGYAPPPMVDGYAGAPYDDVTVVAPDPGLAVGPDGY
jgi:hypothetical protein